MAESEGHGRLCRFNDDMLLCFQSQAFKQMCWDAKSYCIKLFLKNKNKIIRRKTKEISVLRKSLCLAT